MSFLGKVGHFLVGSQDSLPRGANEEDTLDTLSDFERSFIDQSCMTLQTASLIEDRRVTAHNLIAFSKLHRVPVGILGLQVVAKVLFNDWEDEEMAQDCVTLLLILCAPKLLDLGPECSTGNAREFCEIFLKDEENLGVLFKILENTHEVYLQHDLLLLLYGLVEASPSRLQSIFMSAAPNGIPSLTSILSESNKEFLQIDALMLLSGLANGCSELCKAMAFQSMFEVLLALLKDSDLGEGDVSVEGSLSLIYMMLLDIPSNQVLFFENEHLAKLTALLSNAGDNCSILVYEIISSMLDPWISRIVPSVQSSIVSNQELIALLYKAAFFKESSIQVQETALILFEKVLRGYSEGKKTMTRFQADGDLFVVSLIRKAIENSSAAALNLFQTLVCDEDALKIGIAATFAAPPVDDEDEGVSPASAGSLLIDAFISPDYKQKEIGLKMLSSLLLDCKACKEMALAFKVSSEPVESEEDAFSIGLLLSLMFDFIGTPKSEVPLLSAFISCFIIWFDSCPEAVAFFLSERPVLVFLLELSVESYTSLSDRTLIQGLALVLYGVCSLYTKDPAEFKQYIRTKIGNEIFRGKWMKLAQSLDFSLGETFITFFRERNAHMLKAILLPPGQSLNPETDALRLLYENTLATERQRAMQLEATLNEQQHMLAQFESLRAYAADLESRLRATEGELQFARLSLSDADTLTTLTSLKAENERLQQLANSYMAQMLEMATENEELLRVVSEYEAYPAANVVAEKRQEEKVASIVEAAISKLQPSSLVSKIQAPQSTQSTTFDV